MTGGVGEARVDVLPGDTEETLSARVLVEEHKLYPYAVRLFVEDRLRIEHGEVRVLETNLARQLAEPSIQYSR